jgi:hypothetical protein
MTPLDAEAARDAMRDLAAALVEWRQALAFGLLAAEAATGRPVAIAGDADMVDELARGAGRGSSRTRIGTGHGQ